MDVLDQLKWSFFFFAWKWKVESFNSYIYFYAFSFTSAAKRNPVFFLHWLIPQRTKETWDLRAIFFSFSFLCFPFVTAFIEPSYNGFIGRNSFYPWLKDWFSSWSRGSSIHYWVWLSLVENLFYWTVVRRKTEMVLVYLSLCVVCEFVTCLPFGNTCSVLIT